MWTKLSMSKWNSLVIFLKNLWDAVKWKMYNVHTFTWLFTRHNDVTEYVLLQMHATSVMRYFCMFCAIVFFLKTVENNIKQRKTELFNIFEGITSNFIKRDIFSCVWARSSQWWIVRRRFKSENTIFCLIAFFIESFKKKYSF